MDSSENRLGEADAATDAPNENPTLNAQADTADGEAGYDAANAATDAPNENPTLNAQADTADGEAGNDAANVATDAPNENQTYGGAPTTIGGKLENFWYHYKWHTIVSIVVVIIASIIIAQLVSAPKYDINIIYAGGYRISRLSSDGDVSPFETLIQSLRRVVPDANNDGNVNISLQDHYVLTEDEITALENAGRGDTINPQKIYEDYQNLGVNLVTGDYHLVIMSESLFREYDEKYSGGLFVDLTPYMAEGVSYSTPEGTTKAIYLSDIPFGELPLIEKMIDYNDKTVVCLRGLSENLTTGSKGNTREFEAAEQAVKNILSYGR